MDHPSTAIRPEQWRQTALVAWGVAALELFVLALLIVFLIVRPLMADDAAPAAQKANAKQSAAPPAAQKKAPPAQPKLQRTQTSVIVLNGNGISGMASEKADLVRTRGYVIAGTANAPRTDFARSVVMYRPGYEPEARRFARDFRIGRVSPLDGMRPGQLQGAHIALIVGNS
jgi:LytR cell envelope-related transcriptional attenuator